MECSAPEEHTCSRLDERFLPRLRQQTPRQSSAPFFPQVHYEVTPTLCTSTLQPPLPSLLLTAPEKRYEKLPPLVEAMVLSPNQNLSINSAPSPSATPKRQGPHPKIKLDPEPQKLSCSIRKEEEKAKSRWGRTTLQNFSSLPPNPLFSSGYWRRCVHFKHWACSFECK